MRTYRLSKKKSILEKPNIESKKKHIKGQKTVGLMDHVNLHPIVCHVSRKKILHFIVIELANSKIGQVILAFSSVEKKLKSYCTQYSKID